MTSAGLVAKALWREPIQSLLLIVASTVAFAVFATFLSIGDLLLGGAEQSAQNRLVTLNKVNFTQPVPAIYRNQVLGIDGVQRVAGVMWFGGAFRDINDEIATFAVDVTPWLEIKAEDIRVNADAKARFVSNRTGLLVGQSIAQRYGWSVGDTIPLISTVWRRSDGSRTWSFTISGIIGANGASDGANYLIMHFPYLDEARSFGRDTYGNLLVETVSATQTEAVAEAIDQLFANSRFETRTTTEQAFAISFVDQLGNVALMIYAITSVAIVTLILILTNALIFSVRQRFTEFAVLRALGHSDGRIRALIYAETAAFLLLGAALGLICAHFAVPPVTRLFSDFADAASFSPVAGVQTLMLAAGLTICCGTLPAFLVTRMPVIKALRSI